MKKRFLSIILGLVITAGAAFPAVASPRLLMSHPDIDFGDINADSSITIIDVSALQRLLVGLPVSVVTDMVDDTGLLDLNEDDYLDICDATALQRYLAGLDHTSDLLGLPRYTWMTEAAPSGEYVPVQIYSQQNPVVSDYLTNTIYSASVPGYSTINSYANQQTSYKKDQPFGAKVTFTSSGTLKITDSYSGAETERQISAGTHTLYNLTPNSISAYVLYKNGSAVQYGALYPTGNVRMLMMTMTRNIRDIGGWKCDGGTVRYGKIFRGGEVFQEDVDVFNNTLGIRHELTLRYTDECPQNYSLINDDTGWTQVDGPWYALTPIESEYTILSTVFNSVANDRPIYIHCAAGADRTGTQICVLEALLGISREDIDKDYELTTLYTGTASDVQSRRRNEAEWRRLISTLSKCPGTTFRDKAVNWVLSLGFTKADINNFRAKMIEGSPEILQ